MERKGGSALAGEHFQGGLVAPDEADDIKAVLVEEACHCVLREIDDVIWRENLIPVGEALRHAPMACIRRGEIEDCALCKPWHQRFKIGMGVGDVFDDFGEEGEVEGAPVCRHGFKRTLMIFPGGEN